MPLIIPIYLTQTFFSCEVFEPPLPSSSPCLIPYLVFKPHTVVSPQKHIWLLLNASKLCPNSFSLFVASMVLALWILPVSSTSGAALNTLLPHLFLDSPTHKCPDILNVSLTPNVFIFWLTLQSSCVSGSCQVQPPPIPDVPNQN